MLTVNYYLSCNNNIAKRLECSYSPRHISHSFLLIPAGRLRSFGISNCYFKTVFVRIWHLATPSALQHEEDAKTPMKVDMGYFLSPLLMCELLSSGCVKNLKQKWAASICSFELQLPFEKKHGHCLNAAITPQLRSRNKRISIFNIYMERLLS